MKQKLIYCIWSVWLISLLSVTVVSAATREVGPGKTYARIEAAFTASSPGDSILVYPQAGNAAYTQVVLYINKRKIVIQGQMTGGQRVLLNGQGYDYSGAGSIPRAMFQFNLGYDSCIVENFTVEACTNTSYNGAGFSINQANGIVVRNCEIRHNDMGIMSNGSVSANTASDQLIENCIIHDNGNSNDSGYNHNLYLGGTSVTVRGCNIYNATTGHDLKSRAHQTFVEGCFLHDSPNREFDLVDEAGNTTVPESHTLISGCVIVKRNPCPGNKAVIHFGQDGGKKHNGTLFIVHCTILTPHKSPVVDLSDTSAGVKFANSLIMDPTGSASGQVLINLRNGAVSANTAGQNVWLSSGFPAPSGNNFTQITVGAAGVLPAFINTGAGDFTWPLLSAARWTRA